MAELHNHTHHHSHNHPHAHAHGHSHSHIPTNFTSAFIIGIVLNTLYVVVEFGYGVAVNSMSLIADAGHNLSDVLGLLLAWGAAWLAKRNASKKHTYGFRKSTILASLINSVLLFVAIGAITIEAIQRFFNPVSVPGSVVMIVAGIGLVINAATAMLFMRGKEHDLNIKAAFMHMAADALVSGGVVVAGLVVLLTGYTFIDPLVSLIIVVILALGSWRMLRDSASLTMDGVPEAVDYNQVAAYLSQIPGVIGVHDLHIWAMSTTENAMTVHIVTNEAKNNNDFTAHIAEHLHSHFSVHHSTIQMEINERMHDCDHTPCAEVKG